MDKVFINCPFDDKFNNDILKPLMFILLKYGFSPELSLNRSDSGELRLEKIIGLMKECTYSIHDLSKLKLKRNDKIARMNMPFELGIDWGLRNCGNEMFRNKKFLILTAEKYEYHKALSDISGYDAKNHENKTESLISVVREWLITNAGITIDETSNAIYYEYIDFMCWLYFCFTKDETETEEINRKITNISSVEYIQFVHKFLNIRKTITV